MSHVFYSEEELQRFIDLYPLHMDISNLVDECRQYKQIIEQTFHRMEQDHESEVDTYKEWWKEAENQADAIDDEYANTKVAIFNLIEEICASAKYLKPEIAVKEIMKSVEVANASGLLSIIARSAPESTEQHSEAEAAKDGL